MVGIGKCPRRTYWHKSKRIHWGDSRAPKDQKLLAILGIRRSGKSTLIYQSIKYLLDNGTDPKNIFYINADDFEKPGREDLEEALDFCQQNNMVSLKETKSYIFIDEIQNVKGWQQLLKKFYDLK